MTNISNPSGSDSGSCPYIGRNEDDVDFDIHTNSDSESKENTMNNKMLYEISEEDFDDSDAKPIHPEWQLLQLLKFFVSQIVR